MIYIYREVANILNNEIATILNVRLKDPTRTCRLATFKIKRKDFAASDCGMYTGASCPKVNGLLLMDTCRYGIYVYKGVVRFQYDMYVFN